MIEGLLLILLGLGLLVALVVVLRSASLRRRAYRSNASFRAFARLSPAAPEAFARRFEVGVYCGMCLGVMLVILGLLTAAG